MTTASTASFATLRITRDDVLRFDHPVLLSAVRGTLWITVDGQPDDIVLDAGTSRAFDGSARVLATTLGGEAMLGVMREAQADDTLARLKRWTGIGRRVAGAPMHA